MKQRDCTHDTYISNKVDGKSEEVHVTSKPQIRGQSIELSISNYHESVCGSNPNNSIQERLTVAAIQEREKVEQRKRRKKFPVQLPHQFLLIDASRIGQRLVRSHRRRPVVATSDPRFLFTTKLRRGDGLRWGSHGV
jgi:hypothetical protein